MKQLKQFLELSPEDIHFYNEYVIRNDKRMRITLSCGAARDKAVIVLDRPRCVPSGQSAPMRFLPSGFLFSDAEDNEEQRLCVRL